jgi:hypothetical protein
VATTAKTLPLIATVSSIALSRADPGPDEARLILGAPRRHLSLYGTVLPVTVPVGWVAVWM